MAGREDMAAFGLAGLKGRRGGSSDAAAAPAPLCREPLEPGDRVLLDTDGVTEGRAADGTPFGVERLADFIVGHSSSLLPAPEMMRRLSHSVLEYQQGQLRDDVTAVLIEWQPGSDGRALVP